MQGDPRHYLVRFAGVACCGLTPDLHMEVEQYDHLAAGGLEESLLHVAVEDVHLVSLQSGVAETVSVGLQSALGGGRRGRERGKGREEGREREGGREGEGGGERGEGGGERERGGEEGGEGGEGGGERMNHFEGLPRGAVPALSWSQ